MSKPIRFTIRDVSPCKDCKRPHKKPGCHDTCEEMLSWQAEKKRVKKARQEYERERFHGCFHGHFMYID